MAETISLLTDEPTLDTTVVADPEERAPEVAVTAPTGFEAPPPPDPFIEPLPAGPEPQAPLAAPPSWWAEDPHTISAIRIIEERPDVLAAYFKSYVSPRNPNTHNEWVRTIGGDTAEAFATFWYEKNGRYEGYSQGPTTAQETIDLSRIMVDRPDVLSAYFRDYAEHKGWKEDGWRDRIAGSSREDYAKYWYENHGKWEGYNQRPAPQAAQPEPDLIQPEAAPVCGAPGAEAAPPTPEAAPAVIDEAFPDPASDEAAIVIVGAAPMDGALLG